MGAASARLHVLLSRDGTSAVVFRRGPSKVVGTFAWNRHNDTFTLGQWFRGRIYERRSDLSPDGKYLIYFAMNGRWGSETKGSWTAVSRAPYLKALALWPKGDCWNGGGLFTRDNRYWLNDGYGHARLHDTEDVIRDRSYQPPAGVGNNECLGVYYPRLIRDGWEMMPRTKREEGVSLTVFEKPLMHSWVLRKCANASTNHPIGKGVYYDEHELVNSETAECLSFPEWEWADIDHQRLVWAAGGALHAAEIGAQGPVDKRVLHDFNADAYTRIVAPY